MKRVVVAALLLGCGAAVTLGVARANSSITDRPAMWEYATLTITEDGLGYDTRGRTIDWETPLGSKEIREEQTADWSSFPSAVVETVGGTAPQDARRVSESALLSAIGRQGWQLVIYRPDPDSFWGPHTESNSPRVLVAQWTFMRVQGPWSTGPMR